MPERTVLEQRLSPLLRGLSQLRGPNQGCYLQLGANGVVGIEHFIRHGGGKRESEQQRPTHVSCYYAGEYRALHWDIGESPWAERSSPLSYLHRALWRSGKPSPPRICGCGEPSPKLASVRMVTGWFTRRHGAIAPQMQLTPTCGSPRQMAANIVNLPTARGVIRQQDGRLGRMP